MFAPHFPRLDWIAWFLPIPGCETDTWFSSFCFHLLKGTPEVLALLHGNPFPEKPPKYIRTATYLYEFTSAEEKKKSGCWWKRRYIGPYYPILVSRSPNI